MYGRLVHLEDFMSQHLSIRIGDGSSYFWTTRWMDLGPLLSFNPAPRLPDLTLAQAYDGGAWQLHLFSADLPSFVLQAILSIQLYFVDQPDLTVWDLTPTGDFTVASAYAHLRPLQLEREQLSYVWKPEIPLKHSVFLWRLLNGLLPFGEVLQSFGICLPSKCPFCPALDSLHHGFAQCPLARQLWAYFFQMMQLSVSDSYDLWDIFNYCWQFRMDQLHVVLRLLPSAICWVLWRARNSKIFSEQEVPFQSLRLQVLHLLHCYTLTAPLSVASSSAWNHLHSLSFLRMTRLQHYCKPVRWSFPCRLKLNIDGSCLQHLPLQPTGGGMVLRDFSGCLLFAESHFFGSGSSLSAEIMALFHGLRLCHSQGYRNVEVETDSMLLVQFVHKKAQWPWKYFSILVHILLLLPLVASGVSHTYREANSLADFLAKHASSSLASHSYTLSTLPRKARGIHQLDLIGLPSFRFLTRKPP